MEQNAAKNQQEEWRRESANEKVFKLGNAIKTSGATIRGLQKVFVMSCAEQLS